MNPYIIGAVIALLIGDFAAGYYFRGQHDTAKVEKTEIKADQGQIQQEAKQLQVNNASEAQYVQDIQNPPPLVIKQPVWLHAPALCPSVPVPAAAGGPQEPAPARPADPRPAEDLRPQLAAFAARYESVIAGCREGARDWPQPILK